MHWKSVTFLLLLWEGVNAVRLNNIFQYLDGFKSDYNLKGYLHVGDDYAVFLRNPKAHDKYLTYELYESKNVDDLRSYKPRLLAVSKIPVDYIKEQLKIFRKELYKAKYVNGDVVPGTKVKTVREWQIENALKFDTRDLFFDYKPAVLRAIL